MSNHNKIAANMQTSFALNNKGDYFFWGNCSSALLTVKSDKDFTHPRRNTISYYNSQYKCESISCGNFHAGVIASNMTKYESQADDVSYAKELFKSLFENFENKFCKIFEKNPTDELDDMIKMIIIYLLKLPEQYLGLSDCRIKFFNFKKSFLQTFYSYQKEHKRDIIKMETIYENFLRKEFEVDITDEFSFEKFNKITSHKSQEFKEIKRFIMNGIIHHFKNYNDDFIHFVRILAGFKSLLNLNELGEVFSFATEYSTKISKTIERIFDDMKILINGAYYVEIHKITDNIIGRSTGEGMLFMWGLNTEGRLGIEDHYCTEGENTSNYFESNPHYQIRPYLVTFPNYIKIVKISCGFSHTLALSSQMKVFSFGNGKYGCLGLGKCDIVSTPACIESDDDGNDFSGIIDISAGFSYSMALDYEGNVYSWGHGADGRLGHGEVFPRSNGEYVNYLAPKRIKYLEKNKIKIARIASGESHSLALSKDNNLFSWGNGSFGKLGLGYLINISTPGIVEFSVSNLNKSFADTAITYITCGSNNSACITADNKIFIWGKNYMSDKTAHYNEENYLIPHELVMNLESDSSNSHSKINEISLGTKHMLILLSNGSIYVYGKCPGGILGRADYPVKINNYSFYATEFKEDEDILGKNKLFNRYTDNFTLKVANDSKGYINDRINSTSVIYISCNQKSTSLITDSGELYICGDNNIPDGSREVKTDVKYIYKIDYFLTVKEKVIFIALGRNHTIVITDKFNAYSWGCTKFGKLGIEVNNTVNNSIDQLNLQDIPKDISNMDRSNIITTPTLIFTSHLKIRMAAVSDTHSLLLSLTGEVLSCGLNLKGTLGLNVKENYLSKPQIIPGISKCKYIACSNSHSGCIASNELGEYEIFTFGCGSAGKLGHNNVDDQYSPRKVEINHKANKSQIPHFIKLSFGEEFSLALDIEGNLWSWGRKKYLGLFENEKEINNDIICSPIRLTKYNKKFIYISSNSTCSYAIDNKKNLNLFGIVMQNPTDLRMKYYKLDLIDQEEAENNLNKISEREKFILVSAGFNHFAAINYQSKKSNFVLPYTWGLNLYNRCGGDFKVSSIPRRINFFENLFKENEADPGNEFNLLAENCRNSNTSNTSKRENEIQKEIKEEKENLNLDDLKRAYSECEYTFLEKVENYVFTMRDLTSKRKDEDCHTENLIIKSLNKIKCEKFFDAKIYEQNFNKSNNILKLPECIKNNIIVYESVISLLSCHPCFIVEIFKHKEFDFIKFIKIIFNMSDTKFFLLQNKKFTTNNLIKILSLWNCVFEMEKNKFKIHHEFYSIKEIEKLLSYQIYEFIVLNFSQIGINFKNLTNFFYEIISQMSIHILQEILKLPNVDISNLINNESGSNDNDILLIYRSIDKKSKEKIILKITLILIDKVKEFFKFANESNNFLKNEIFWILKNLSKLFKNLENRDLKFMNLFHIFFFGPFINFLNLFLNNNEKDNNKNLEKTLLLKTILKSLQDNKTKDEYCQLYNFLNTIKKDGKNFEFIVSNIFSQIFERNSEILMDMINIFKNLQSFYMKIILSIEEKKESHSMEMEESDDNEEEVESESESDSSNSSNTDEKSNELTHKIKGISNTINIFLKNYNFDFTFESLKYSLHSDINFQSEEIVYQITLSQLIFINNILAELQLPSASIINKIEDNDNLVCEKENTNSLKVFVQILTILMSKKTIRELDTDSFRQVKILSASSKIFPSEITNYMFNIRVNPLIQWSIYNKEISLIHTGEKNNSKINNNKNSTNYLSKCETCKLAMSPVFIGNNYKDQESDSNKKKTLNLFKLISVPFNDDLTVLFEEVLSAMPVIHKNSEIINVVERCIDKIIYPKDNKSAADHKNLEENLSGNENFKSQIILYQNFLTKFNEEVSPNKKFGTSSNNNLGKDSVFLIEKLFSNARINLEKKKKYCAYLSKLNSYVESIGAITENLKNNFYVFEEGNRKFIKNFDGEYIPNHYTSKVSFTELVRMRIVNEKVYKSLNSKNYFVFEKEENGLKIKIILREKSKSMLCGSAKNEYVVEEFFLSSEMVNLLRRLAAFNYNFNFKEICLNSFYFVKYINSLENN